MDHALIIQKLGGYEAAAGLLKRNRSRTHRWQTQGIPRSVWPEVIAAAAKQAPEITLDALLAGERKIKATA